MRSRCGLLCAGIHPPVHGRAFFAHFGMRITTMAARHGEERRARPVPDTGTDDRRTRAYFLTGRPGTTLLAARCAASADTGLTAGWTFFGFFASLLLC